MTSDATLDAAVRHAIVVSAQVAAHQNVAMAQSACARLGRLSSGRWRAAARDLDQLKDELERSLENLAAELADRAERLGIHEEALWAAGDCAALLDELREKTLQHLDAGSPAERLLGDDGPIFGATFLDHPDVENRGTTLLMGWADPLHPALWSWEASWVSVPDDEDGDEGDAFQELDLFGLGEIVVESPLLADVAERLAVPEARARELLEELASAFTRAALLVAAEQPDEEAEWENDEA